jgi:uncharacterized protein (TIGR02594 family)
VKVTAFDLAQRFVGVREMAGDDEHPLIQWGFMLCDGWTGNTPDEVPWCSAWLQIPCHMLSLPRSKSALARSWLRVGRAVALDSAQVGWDVVVLSRGKGQQPGPSNLTAPGHVGLFAGDEGAVGRIWVLGGNQSDSVSIAPYPASRVLGVRRLR